jgi:hypothetical protein
VQARTDNLAKVVLLTLPYIAVSPKKPSEALDAIVDRLTTYMDSRDTNETVFVSPFQSANTDVCFLSTVTNSSPLAISPLSSCSGCKLKH